jgi:hypothetical protein
VQVARRKALQAEATGSKAKKGKKGKEKKDGKAKGKKGKKADKKKSRKARDDSDSGKQRRRRRRSPSSSSDSSSSSSSSETEPSMDAEYKARVTTCSVKGRCHCNSGIFYIFCKQHVKISTPLTFPLLGVPPSEACFHSVALKRFNLTSLTNNSTTTVSRWS